MDEYFLGVHRPHWLETSERPLFVSHRTLCDRKSLPRARTRWALDSGGFTELNMHGRWLTTPREYAAAVRRYRDEVGSLAFAAQQDWMCEPAVLKRTGLSVAEHQARTIDNYLELSSIAPDLPWLPVVQGWARGDYGRHIEQWADRGVELDKLERVGLGTICRRSDTVSASLIVAEAAWYGLRLHCFGLKLRGLQFAEENIVSADSLSWSYAARRENRSDGWRLAGRKTGEQNKLSAALEWYDDRIAPMLEPREAIALPRAQRQQLELALEGRRAA
jgi:hypothetical protein